MTNQRYSPEFKDEAVRQIIDRGYSVTEVSQRRRTEERRRTAKNGRTGQALGRSIPVFTTSES